MDSLTASINAVIAQSVQMEAQKKAELEGSGLSRHSSSSSHSGSDGMSTFIPDNLISNKPPSLVLAQNTQPSMPLVRPQNQTKTALAKLLNTRSNSTGTPPYDVPHMIPPQQQPQHQIIPSQQNIPPQEQQGQMMPQQHWQPAQQVQQQQWKQPQVQQMGHFQPPPSPSPHMVVSPGLGPGQAGPMMPVNQHGVMVPQQQVQQHMQGPQVSSAQMVHQQGMVQQQQMGVNMNQQQIQYNQQHQMQQASMMMHQQGVHPQQGGIPQQPGHVNQQQFVQTQQHMGGMGNMPMQHRMNMV